LPLLLLGEQEDAVELLGDTDVSVWHEALEWRSPLVFKRATAQADLFLVKDPL
jgi:hypothetical protein